jgi:hypothetical protein
LSRNCRQVVKRWSGFWSQALTIEEAIGQNCLGAGAAGLGVLSVGDERIYFYAEKIKMAEPTKEELMARIAELEKQTGGSKRSGTLEFRVGEKGGVSVYGLGRFPVTLYYEQWVRLLDATDGLRAFLEENKHRLKLKTKE